MKPVIFPRSICDVAVADGEEVAVVDLVELAVDHDPSASRAVGVLVP